MRIVGNPHHSGHHPAFEFFRGRKVPCFEKPERFEIIHSALIAQGLLVEQPQPFPDTALYAVHAPRYLDFLAGAWEEWVSTGNEGDAFPSVWAIRGMRSDVLPENFAARLGMFSFDTGTPLMAGTWQAARSGADCAITAGQWVAKGEQAAFVLTRPPGHHAGPDFFGGYCFLNNAAIAAQTLLDQGAKRVAILDVDFHHGNGTQEIFYRRSDVLFASLHGDPRSEYPFFTGHADEQGEGEGAGYTLNLPLPAGTSAENWFAALAQALARIREVGAEALVISLGTDAFEGDPISKFKLRTSDYHRLGQALAQLGLPAVFVFEGGYAVAEVGANVMATLTGFSG